MSVIRCISIERLVQLKRGQHTHTQTHTQPHSHTRMNVKPAKLKVFSAKCCQLSVQNYDTEISRPQEAEEAAEEREGTAEEEGGGMAGRTLYRVI